MARAIPSSPLSAPILHYSSSPYVLFPTAILSFSVTKAIQAQFERAGINIEDYAMRLPRGLHRLAPDGIHPEYNAAWEDFFEQNEYPTKAEILEALSKIEARFGISPTAGFYAMRFWKLA